MAEISAELQRAAERSKQLPQKPDNEELLTLYGLFKQATEGDVQGEAPGGFDFVGNAKFHAWEKQQGKSNAQASQEYIDFVTSLEAKYGA